MKVVLVTGGFDPLHSGHIEYFKAAKELGDILMVGLNSDEWLVRKKGRPFMPFKERAAIIKELSCVGGVFEFDDSDDHACEAIRHIKDTFPNNSHIIFANGGDRKKGTTPEVAYAKKLADECNITFVFGMGGYDKKNSSSWILDEWKTQKTERDWGYWRVLDDNPEQGYKVKELVIYPGKSLSNQKHYHRSEQWMVLEGIVKMHTEYNGMENTIHLEKHNRPYEIDKEVWHEPSNPTNKNCHILEVQWGDCYEEDIERR